MDDTCVVRDTARATTADEDGMISRDEREWTTRVELTRTVNEEETSRRERKRQGKGRDAMSEASEREEKWIGLNTRGGEIADRGKLREEEHSSLFCRRKRERRRACTMKRAESRKSEAHGAWARVGKG